MYMPIAFNQQPIHRGSINPRKLTPAQAVEIGKRRFCGERVRDLALEFGVTAAYIYNKTSPIEN